MSMAAASPRHTASPPSPPPGVIDPNATPAALAKLLADQLHECEALRAALSSERARAEAAERQLAALQGPPATAIAEYEERLRQADQARVAAERMRDASERAREDAEARVRGIAESWAQLNAYLRMAEVRAADARLGFDRLVNMGGQPVPMSQGGGDSGSMLIPGARRARSPSMDAGAYPPAKRSRHDPNHRARSRSTSPSVEELIIEASGEAPADSASQTPRRATYPPAYAGYADPSRGAYDANRAYDTHRAYTDPSHLRAGPSNHNIQSQVVQLTPHNAYQRPSPPNAQLAPTSQLAPTTQMSTYPTPPQLSPTSITLPPPHNGLASTSSGALASSSSGTLASSSSGAVAASSSGALPATSSSTTPLPAPRKHRERPLPNPQRGIGTVKHHYQSRPFAPKASPFMKEHRNRARERERERERDAGTPASRVSPSDEDAPGSPDSTFNAGNTMANGDNSQDDRMRGQDDRPRGQDDASNDPTPANSAPSYPKTNAEGQRICRQCGQPGRYKDGKCVEKWGPGPMGPGTVCDRCRKKMKRVERRGTMGGIPNPTGGTLINLTSQAPTTRVLQHARTMPAYPDDRHSPYNSNSDRRPEYSPERFDRRYEGEDRAEDRGRYVADDRFEDRAQYASGSRDYAGEERRYAGEERRYASGDEGPRYRDFVKEARYGRTAQAYASSEPRYGDPRFGAYDSISESRQRYPASVSEARYSTPHRALTAQATYPPGPNARYASGEALGDYRNGLRQTPVDGRYVVSYPHAPTSQRSLTADAPSPSSRMATSPVRVVVASPVSEDADGEAEEEDELMMDEPTQPDEVNPAWNADTRARGLSDAMDVDGPRLSNAQNNASTVRLSPRRSPPARRISPARPQPPEDDIDADIAAAIDGPPTSRTAPSMSARSVHDDDVDADIAAAVGDPPDDAPRSRHASEARSRHGSRHDDVDADIAAAVDGDPDTVDADIAAAVDADADPRDAARSASRVAYSDSASHSSVDADGEAEEAGRGSQGDGERRSRSAYSAGAASAYVAGASSVYPHPTVPAASTTDADADGEAEDEDDELLAAVDAAEAGERA
ncbi:uncharacterized protein SCHCODRAFT_02697489 [Schizophyllum commune H4-8]|uniref:uncharacterized protein n=1 Tax=Schizophyllum commune (strain H4-8 / FGSC 9210) TaxID=578458 RepID=UPI002160B9E6|nr:uncharacterized protein SCHCODRAFT_02697489 [Schizophyllum commune H4-8]KAI5895987.1 hypothetical protein SCHCODRAFT_02697489 [Schizophyllum commune H4-8]